MKISIRNAKFSDIKSIIKIEKEVWANNGATQKMIESRLKTFSDGALVAVNNSRVIGSLFFQLVHDNKSKNFTEWAEYTDNGLIKATHRIDGDTLFGVSLSVLPTYRERNIGTKLMMRVAEKVIKYNVKKCILGSRIPGFNNYPEMSIDKYLKLRSEDGKLIDPELRFYKRFGLMIAKILPNYFNDIQSKNYGILFEWKNPFYKENGYQNTVTKKALTKFVPYYLYVKFFFLSSRKGKND